MQLNKAGEYAVQFMLHLGTANTVRIEDAAHTLNIPYFFLAQIASKLKRSGIIKSVRGPGGGYVLARSTNEITIKDILLSVGECIYPARGITGNGEVRSNTPEFKLMQTYFENLGMLMQECLTTTSVADLVRKSRNKAVVVESPNGSSVYFDRFAAIEQNQAK